MTEAGARRFCLKWRIYPRTLILLANWGKTADGRRFVAGATLKPQFPTTWVPTRPKRRVDDVSLDWLED